MAIDQLVGKRQLNSAMQEMEDFNKVLDDFIKETEATPAENSKKALDITGETLANKIREKYESAKGQRTELEDIWLKDLRQYRGVYSPDVLEKMHPNRSRAFVRLTRTKVKTVDSRLSDFLFPANGDKNWSIAKTPIAQYTNDQMRQLATMLQQGGQNVTPAQLQLLVDQTADERAKRMALRIEDQLTDLRYRDIIKEVLHSGNLYGTGVLKGPMVNIKKQHKYSPSVEGGTWQMETVDNLTPFIESVSIWDIFPDMSATNIADCNFIIQRHKMPKYRLLELAQRGDFSGGTIKQYISNTELGDFEDQYYDLELQTLGGLNSPNTSTKESKKYEVLEFWGYLDANDLSECGVDIPDDKRAGAQIAACVWVLGDKVIKACLTPIDGVQWPYYFYYYDKDETSIFGEGIAAIMRDIQELINASFRGMLDNAAISAGPQIEANLDLLDESEDATDVFPFKVWLRTGQGSDAMAPAIRVNEIPSYTTQFIQMNELLEKYGDEVTTIPRYMWGDNPGGGAGRTASGLSMMLGSANITIKDQVKNFDNGITRPFITALYYWNMQFTEDDSIKGDFNVNAQGSSSLIAKEVYSNSLMQLANIAGAPQYANLIKPANVLRSIVEVLDLDNKDLIKSDQEIQAEQQHQMQQQQEMQQFMNSITETARKFGVSPQDMLMQGQALLGQLKASKQQAPAAPQAR